MNPEVKQIIDDLREGRVSQDSPVDLDRIIQDERSIRPAPGDYGDKFDGRIEYLLSDRVFIFYYPRTKSTFPNSRVRFSIAHELGHYFIPEHRQLLLTGNSHGSRPGFVSDTRLEREADEFAASLLIPQDYLERLNSRRKFLTLKDLLQLANDLQVSATAMAIRYTQMCSDRCAVILSQGGRQKFYLASEEMEYTGFKWRGCKDIPGDSASAKAAQNQGSRNVFDKASDSSLWFSGRKRECEIWEEAFPLGYTGLVLTMLADRSYNG